MQYPDQKDISITVDGPLSHTQIEMNLLQIRNLHNTLGQWLSERSDE